MRLTLRTLIAYMDDALPPIATQLIGRKIAASDAAKKMMRRIRKVLRRRRLTAPPVLPESSAGDPNLVAEYLDDVLDPVTTARIENRCLKHDLHLAEIAGCHQVISRVNGDPIEVAPDVRLRIYKALGITAQKRSTIPSIGMIAEPDQVVEVTKPQAWWQARWVFPTTVLLLIVALGGVLRMALFDDKRDTVIAAVVDDHRPVFGEKRPEKTEPKVLEPTDEKSEPKSQVKEKAKSPADSLPVKGPTKVEEKKTEPKKDTKDKKEIQDAGAKTGAKSKVPPAPPMPVAKKEAGKKPASKPLLTARYVSASGILFRLKDDGPERLQTNDEIRTGEVVGALEGPVSVVSLSDGNRAEFFDTGRARLVGGDQPAFQLERGRATIVVDKSPMSLGIAGDYFEIVSEAKSTRLHLEYLPGVTAAAAKHPAAILVVNDPVRPVKLRYRDRLIDLPAGWAVSVASGRGPGTAYADPNGGRPVKKEMSQVERTALDRLADRNIGIPFGSEGILLALREKMHDRNREARRIAIRTLAAVDAFSLLVDALGDPTYPENRVLAVESFRTILKSDPSGERKVREALSRSFPQDDCETILTLLVGVNPATDKTNPEVVKRLVQQLDSESLAIRELALINLKDMYGKDFGYNASDSPSRRSTSVRLWKNLIGQ